MLVEGIIVLEGPDCVGKTTLANKFREEGAFVIHATNRWLDNMWLYHTAILNIAINKAFREHRLVVLDRHWPSEQVYASVFRAGGKTPKAGRFMDRILRRFHALYINCLPLDQERHLDLYSKNIDPNHDYKIDAFKKVVEGYHDMWFGLSSYEDTFGDISPLHQDSYGFFLAKTGGQHFNRSDCWHYDLFRDTPEDLVSQAQGYLADKQCSEWTLDPDLRNLAGTPSGAKSVLVGDRVNTIKVRNRRHEPWPFYDYAASSLFLTEALDSGGVREEDICIINGLHEIRHESGALRFLRETYPSIKPVALGGQATLSCVQAGYSLAFDVKTIHHPSYAKRFNEPNYAKTLKEAIECVR